VDGPPSTQPARDPATRSRARQRVVVVVERVACMQRTLARFARAGYGQDGRMSEPDTQHPREDDRNEEIDDSPAPDPEQGVTPQDDPQAD
jgi:hypothetical protein